MGKAKLPHGSLMAWSCIQATTRIKHGWKTMYVDTEFSPRTPKDDSIYNVKQNWRNFLYISLWLNFSYWGQHSPKASSPFQHVAYKTGGKKQINSYLPISPHASSVVYSPFLVSSLFGVAQLSFSNIFQLLCPSINIHIYIKDGLRIDYTTRTPFLWMGGAYGLLTYIVVFLSWISVYVSSFQIFLQHHISILPLRSDFQSITDLNHSVLITV